MSSCRSVALGEVLEPTQRADTVDATREYRLLGVRLDGGGPFLRETLTGAELSAKTLYRVEAGDFIYSRLFAWRGAFGVISPGLEGCHVSNEFPVFVPRDGRVDPRYVEYWFRLPRVLERVFARCTGSTPLTRNRFKEHFFLDLEMPLPPIEEQRRVVEKLDHLAASMEASRAHASEAARLDPMVTSSLRDCLFSAEATHAQSVALASVCDITIGATPSRREPMYWAGKHAWVSIADLNDGVLASTRERITDAGVTESSVKPVMPGTLLMSFKLTIGKMAVAGLPLYTNEAIAALPIKDSRLSGVEYLREALLASDLLQNSKDAIKGRTLNRQSLESIEIVLPTHERQAAIVRNLSACRRGIQSIGERRDRATGLGVALTKSVLNRAFSTLG